MAVLIRSRAVTLVAVVAAFTWVWCTASREQMVGRKTEVANVRTNKEVQELGKFSVEEFNWSVRVQREGEEELRFLEMVEAQQQVVFGIKYYLKLQVTQGDGDEDPRMFDSVVVVKTYGFVPSNFPTLLLPLSKLQES